MPQPGQEDIVEEQKWAAVSDRKVNLNDDVDMRFGSNNQIQTSNYSNSNAKSYFNLQAIQQSTNQQSNQGLYSSQDVRQEAELYQSQTASFQPQSIGQSGTGMFQSQTASFQPQSIGQSATGIFQSQANYKPQTEFKGPAFYQPQGVVQDKGYFQGLAGSKVQGQSNFQTQQNYQYGGPQKKASFGGKGNSSEDNLEFEVQ